MVLYLLRHGDAEDGAGEDAARRLTAKGERQAEAAGGALGLEPEIAEELRGSPFDGPGLAAGRGDVLLVGHEPVFSGEVARLTGASVKLKKGGLAIVDGSTLLALLRPRDLAAIASRKE